MHFRTSIDKEWKEENLSPFNELMISWNANRPCNGRFLFYVSVKTKIWSPWLLYCSWGAYGQSSYHHIDKESSVKIYQDTLETIEGNQATGFQIKVVPEGSASLDHIHCLHVYTNSHKNTKPLHSHPKLTSIRLEVPGLSQMTISHGRHRDLCSPTSTTAVTRFLSKNFSINPSTFAENVHDSGFDIFGNWVFNVANAWTHLGKEWACWVERLHNFHDIHRYLIHGNPVVTSVRGPLYGSAAPYANGHLIAVIGYEASTQKVICMDPAFPSDKETHVSYEMSDYMQAWSRRGNIAYVFQENKK